MRFNQKRFATLFFIAASTISSVNSSHRVCVCIYSSLICIEFIHYSPLDASHDDATVFADTLVSEASPCVGMCVCHSKNGIKGINIDRKIMMNLRAYEIALS